jgi:uncharacterized protein
MKIYDQSEIDRICEKVKKNFGEDYPRMNWLNEEEAVKATMERNALLAEIESGLAKDNDGACGTKPHLGPLSPGCRICQHGGWDCTWIDFRCTRNCVYCNSAEDTRTCKDRPPRCREGVFLGPDDHVLYFQLFQKKGLGISGGEPLLRLDFVIDHLKAIRNECGSPYTWLYTNGDLATPAVLLELAKAGLDEIRFDIAAADYDLDRVALAKRFIPTVTVEIPCLPDDFDKLADLLPKMAAIGVNHLNLHQLILGKHNYKNFLKYNYRCLQNVRNPSVHESEMTVLKLMRYAIDNGIELPINYCSTVYKEFFQERNYRRSYTDLVIQPFDGITENGYVRRITLKNAQGNIQTLVDQIKSRNIDPGLWSLAPSGDAITVRADILPQLASETYQMKINYYGPSVKKKDVTGLFERNNIDSEFSHILESPWLNPEQAREWQVIFMGERDFSLERELAEGTIFRSMLRRERMISGLPDVY